MLIGDKAIFAIESGVKDYYKRPSFLACGFFLIHILGRRYGVHSPDATMLACSYGEVERRLAGRGYHTAPFSKETNGGAIADAFRDAIYAPGQTGKKFFDLSQEDFTAVIYGNHLMWAPDGDEAFDDGSYIIQFDVENSVRLIGFNDVEAGYHHDPDTLRDISMDADAFYKILQNWRDAFDQERVSTSKQ